MHGLGEVQHFLLRPFLSGTHTQNITEEEAQLPSSPGYNRDYFEYVHLFFNLHCKNRLAIFPSPAGKSQTKLSLAGKYKINRRQGEFGK